MRPEWIVDCLKAGKILPVRAQTIPQLPSAPPLDVRLEGKALASSSCFLFQHEDYVLWRLRDTPGQSTLSEFRPQPVSRSSHLADRNGQTATNAYHQPAAVPANRSPEGAQKAATDAQTLHNDQEQEGFKAFNDRLQQPNALHQSTDVDTAGATSSDRRELLAACTARGQHRGRRDGRFRST